LKKRLGEPIQITRAPQPQETKEEIKKGKSKVKKKSKKKK
jgi:hypothetical protein